MMSNRHAGCAFRYSSDQSLFVDFEAGAGSRRVEALLRRLQSNPISGVRNLHPAYSSLLVVFDVVLTDHDTVSVALEDALRNLDAVDLPEPRIVEIPVTYGGIAGPDLEEVAALHSLSPAEVVDIHSSAIYTVDFIGFVPGFAYLSGLDPRIATPRLETPRTSVPAGSVGIAGSQTGVYPFITPGGWQIIGRTESKMFETSRKNMSLLEIGDRVRFVAQ